MMRDGSYIFHGGHAYHARWALGIPLVQGSTRRGPVECGAVGGRRRTIIIHTRSEC